MSTTPLLKPSSSADSFTIAVSKNKPLLIISALAITAIAGLAVVGALGMLGTSSLLGRVAIAAQCGVTLAGIAWIAAKTFQNAEDSSDTANSDSTRSSTPISLEGDLTTPLLASTPRKTSQELLDKLHRLHASLYQKPMPTLVEQSETIQTDLETTCSQIEDSLNFYFLRVEPNDQETNRLYQNALLPCWNAIRDLRQMHLGPIVDPLIDLTPQRRTANLNNFKEAVDLVKTTFKTCQQRLGI